MSLDGKVIGGTLLADGLSAPSETARFSSDAGQLGRSAASGLAGGQFKAGPDALADLLAPKSILAIAARFLALTAAAWAAAQGVRMLCKLSGVAADIPSKWPLSMFKVKIPGIHGPLFGVSISAGIMLLFFLFVRRPQQRLTTSPLAVILVGFMLVVGTNLIHGPQYGLVNPHEGPLQYYHDALQVTSTGEFLRGFQAAQSELGCHSRTHPPGAVLFFHALARLVGDSAAISIVIAALAVGLSGVFLYRVLAHEFSRETCSYMTLLFLLIPSVQIYYCATLDAIIASCFLGVLLFIRHPNSVLSVLGTIACVFLASFLTFGACFLIPVIVGFEIITHRSVRKSVAVVCGVGALYGTIYLATGFNYLASLGIASALENPQGLMLLAEPASYVMTRLENIGEIVVFFGPFLVLLCVRGTRTMLREGTCRNLLVLTGLGIFTLLAMFLTGAFRTGETARACLFIYPYLIFPVAAYLHHHACRDEARRRLLLVVFTQTIVMQTFGGYFW